MRPFASLALLLLLPLYACGSPQSSPPKGIWLLSRKDSANTARCDVPGDFRSAPQEVWRIGGGPASYTYLAPVKLGGKIAYFAQARGGLRLVSQAGRVLWSHPNFGAAFVAATEDFDGDGRPEALVNTGSVAWKLVDAATGATRWTHEAPSGAIVANYQILRRGPIRRLYQFPQNSLLGECIDLSGSKRSPVLVWRREYPNAYWKGFGPVIVLADMDRDGLEDVALAGKPGYYAVIDAETGAPKFSLQTAIRGAEQIGRPYGLVAAEDLDGDGYRDLVMISCQVEEYAVVLRNERGRGFRPLWTQFVEQDLPDDIREIRPNITSVSDVNGDGRREIVVGLFNWKNSGKWVTALLDPERGIDSPLAELPGRYFWGCYDLDGDGRPEIVTSEEPVRRTAPFSTFHVTDGRTLKDLASVSGAGLSPGGARLPNDVAFYSSRKTPFYAKLPDGRAGIVVTRSVAPGREYLLRLEAGKAQLDPFRVDGTSRTVLASGESPKLRTLPKLRQGPGAGVFGYAMPAVAVAGGMREMILARSDGKIEGGRASLSAPGRLIGSWTMPGKLANIWLGPNGRRVVCTAEEQRLRIASPRSGASYPVTEIATPHPVYLNLNTRSAPTVLPFGEKRLYLFVGLQTGAHTLACALYDESGKQLWLDEKEGPYPRVSAAVSLDGSGAPSILFDNHGKVLYYRLDGISRTVAHGWYNTIPGRSDGAKYAVPIVGPMGPLGETRVVWAGGLQALETMDAKGARIAKRDTATAYEFEWCGGAVARLRREAWDVGTISRDGIFHSNDVNSCQTRWTLDLSCKSAFPFNLAAGDVDGDGTDNYVVGLPNGDLVALAEKEGRGVILWKTTFEAGVRDVVLADVDGDGKMDILAETDDGAVRWLKPRRRGVARTVREAKPGSHSSRG